MNNNQPITLDPTLVAASKALIQNESAGNFQAKGKSGEYGAGQWMPDTWNAQAKQFLGYVPKFGTDEMTPDIQKAIIYAQAKEDKETNGLNAAQFFAKWNSGSPDGWENKVGVNKQGVSYNVPQYVKNSMDLYEQFKNQGSSPNPTNNTIPQPGAVTPPQENKSIIQKIGDFFTSGTQAFGNTIGNAVAAPQNAQLYADAATQHSDIANNLQEAIKQQIAEGKDPSRLQMALKQHLQSTPSLQDFTGDVINKTPEQVLGQAGQFGLELTSGGILSGGADAIASKELGTLGKIGQGAKIGATYGGLGGGFNAMQDNQSAGGVIGGAALGAGAGALLGGTLSGAGIVAGKTASGVGKVIDTVLPQTEERINKMQQAVQEARVSVADAYKKALPLTPSQQVKEVNLLNKTGDNVYTTLAKYNINAGSDEAISQLQKVGDHFENAINYAKNNEHALFNVDEVKNRAAAEINNSISSEVARNTAKSKIDSEIDAILKANKNSVVKGSNGETLVDSGIMERLRRTGNSWTPFNASDPERVGQSTGWALANAVRDQVEKDGTFSAYREANREWGKIIHAQEVLQKIEDSGKTFKVLGGLAGSVSRKLISAALGLHTGGIAGLIIGEMGSEYGAKILSNPSLRTYFDRKLIERFGNTKATPEAISKLEEEIRQYVDKQSNLLKLPAPSYIPMGPSTGSSNTSSVIQGKYGAPVQPI